MYQYADDAIILRRFQHEKAHSQCPETFCNRRAQFEHHQTNQGFHKLSFPHYKHHVPEKNSALQFTTKLNLVMVVVVSHLHSLIFHIIFCSFPAQ